MTDLVSALCKSFYFEIRHMSHIRNYLSLGVTVTLMVSLVLSKTGLWQCFLVPHWIKMNDDKTETMPVATSQKLRSLDADHVCIGSDRVNFTDKAKNLGVILDSCLSMDSHVNQISKVSYLEIWRLGHLRSYLDINEASALASAFILSRLDYCNSLLAGLPNDKLQKLQRIQNSAARLVFRKIEI